MSELKAFFNEWAGVYDDYLPKLPQYQDLAKQIIGQMKLNNESKILDVGIGTGFMVLGIKKEFGSKIYGIDISDEMIKKCKEKAEKWKMADMNFKVGDATKLEFENNYFDAVLSSFVLHHVPDEKKPLALSEIFRVLKKDGRFVLGEVLVDVEGQWDDPKRLKHIIERWGNLAENALKNVGPKFAVMEIEAMRQVLLREREMLLSERQWTTLIKDAGFRNVESKVTDPKLGYCMISCKK